VVRRGQSFFCGKCAVSRDWEEVIAILQDATVETPVASDPPVPVHVEQTPGP
jgi:hypothetical protein